MAKIIFLLTLLIPAISFGQKIEAKDFSWVKNLKEVGINGATVCGDADIQPTKKSLRKDFLLGAKKEGVLFSGLPSQMEYYAILEQENLQGAKRVLSSRFEGAHLWVVKAGGEAMDLGAPKGIEMRFTSTVKDCMEGAKTTLGSDCSTRDAKSRVSCCREKFIGPELKWRLSEKEYVLGYSPDPSVRLKVPGEKNHRYCVVQKQISF